MKVTEIASLVDYLQIYMYTADFEFCWLEKKILYRNSSGNPIKQKYKKHMLRHVKLSYQRNICLPSAIFRWLQLVLWSREK